MVLADAAAMVRILDKRVGRIERRQRERMVANSPMQQDKSVQQTCEQIDVSSSHSDGVDTNFTLQE